MPNVILAYKRLTHHYAVGYAYMDRHEFVGQFKVLGAPKTFASADGESRDIVYCVHAPRGVSTADVKAAMRDEFHTGCRCEHDCCGHWQTYVGNVRKLRRRHYAVTVHAYINV